MPSNTILSRILPAERRSVGWAFAWFFFALLSYFVVRPVRDMMGIMGGTRGLPWLFTVTFIAMLVAVPIYSSLVARLPRRWLVRVIYHFFAGCLIVFCVLMQADSPAVKLWTARVFFVWVSVFAFYNTSVFWSVLADLFSSAQAKRLYGLIAAGGTLGAFSGSLFASLFADRIPTSMLILLPAVAIEAGLWCAWRLEKQAATISRAAEEDRDDSGAERNAKQPDDSDDQGKIGRGLLSGVTHILKSQYLIAICLFVFYAHLCGTQIYSQQAEIVNANIATNEARTKLFANIDLGAQVLTLLCQTLVAGPLLRRLGVSLALLVLPVVYFFCFASLASHHTLAVLAIVMVATRAATYGIAVPSSEVLFTVLSREDKYKSKNVIDTVLRRGSDALAMQMFDKLKSLAWMQTLALWMLPVTVVWMVAAWTVGQMQRRLAKG